MVLVFALAFAVLIAGCGGSERPTITGKTDDGSTGCLSYTLPDGRRETTCHVVQARFSFPPGPIEPLYSCFEAIEVGQSLPRCWPT